MSELMKNERKKREGGKRKKQSLFNIQSGDYNGAPLGPTFGKDGRWQRSKKHILVCTPPARKQDRTGSRSCLPEYSSNGWSTSARSYLLPLHLSLLPNSFTLGTPGGHSSKS